MEYTAELTIVYVAWTAKIVSVPGAMNQMGARVHGT